MLSYTTQATVESGTFTGITVGGSTSGERRLTTHSGSGFTHTSSTETYSGGTGYTLDFATIREWSATETQRSQTNRSSQTQHSFYSPSTSNLGGGVTETFDASYSYSSSTSSAMHTVGVSGNTSSGISYGTSAQSGYSTGTTRNTETTSNFTDGTQSTTASPTATSLSTTARTGSGTSSTVFRDTFTYGTRTETYSTTDGNCVRYTTSSTTEDVLTDTPTTTRTTWGTDLTSVSHPRTQTTQEASATLTVEGDARSTLTETYGTGGTREASTYARTTSANQMLADTVYLLSDGGSDFLLGHMLWSMTGSGTGESYTARFTELYSATVADSVTVSDYRRVITDSLALVEVSRSIGTTATITATGTAASDTANTTVTTTFTNGYSVYSTSSHSQSWSLGDIGETISTGATGTLSGTTTIFTATDFVSGYETSGNASFTTGTTSTQWAATTTSGTREAWASSYTTTTTASSRSVTEDTVLRGVQTVTSSTGSSSYRSFLGLSRYSTSRVIPETITFTSTAWQTGSFVTSYLLTASTDNTDGYQSGRTTTVFGSHDYTLSTRRRAAATVHAGRYHPPVGNEAWATYPARGWAGFCGSFTQTNPPVYLTTTSGLAAGGTFSDAAPAIGFGSESLVGGVSLVPCDSRSGITLAGGGLVASSLISEPTALVTALSIAATWSSTTATTGTPSTTQTTQAATHTVAVAGSIAGNYWTSHSVTMDSADPNIGYHGPHASQGGYVAGDNQMGSHEVRLAGGAASWTRYTAGVSGATGLSGVVTGTNESVSFTVPQGAAVRVAVEPLLTVSWVTFNAIGTWSGDHVITASPHPNFTA